LLHEASDFLKLRGFSLPMEASDLSASGGLVQNSGNKRSKLILMETN